MILSECPVRFGRVQSNSTIDEDYPGVHTESHAQATGSYKYTAAAGRDNVCPSVSDLTRRILLID